MENISTTTDEEHLASALDGVTDPVLVERIIKAFETWQSGKEYATKERKRLADQLSGRAAQFAEAMAVGHTTANDQALKLQVVEQRWQELEDAKNEKKTVTGALRDALKVAEQKIKDLIADQKSGQMSLFSGPPRGPDGAAILDDDEESDDEDDEYTPDES